jgi:hypothetical protein
MTDNTPRQRLLARLDDIANNKITDWTVNSTQSGGRTVTSPSGQQVRIPNLDTVTEDAAYRALERMDGCGYVQTGRKPSKAQLSVVRDDTAPPVREPDPAVYEGDPPVSAGPVRRKVLLTPQLAAELRGRPWSAVTSDGIELRQRELKRDTVNGIIEVLHDKRSAIELHPHGLQVGENGSLYDGQNRCAAAEESGISFWVWIDYNVHPDKIEGTDSGQGRRSNTTLYMRNFDHANALSAAARLVHCSGQTQMWQRWPQIKLSKLRIAQVAEDNPGLYEWLQWAVDAPQVHPRFQVSSVAAFAYIADQAWPATDEGRVRKNGTDQLHTFLDRVVSGINIRSGEDISLLVKHWLSLHAGAYRRWVKESHLQLLLWAWSQTHCAKPRKSVPKALPQQLVLPYRP